MFCNVTACITIFFTIVTFLNLILCILVIIYLNKFIIISHICLDIIIIGVCFILAINFKEETDIGLLTILILTSMANICIFTNVLVICIKNNIRRTIIKK